MMECRPGCAACCIAPQIATPIPGMPDGKPAGVPCINLDDKLNCAIWNDPDYPDLCRAFKPAIEHCGDDRQHAIRIITELEAATSPD